MNKQRNRRCMGFAAILPQFHELHARISATFARSKTVTHRAHLDAGLFGHLAGAKGAGGLLLRHWPKRPHGFAVDLIQHLCQAGVHSRCSTEKADPAGGLADRGAAHCIACRQHEEQ